MKDNTKLIIAYIVQAILIGILVGVFVYNL